MTTQADVLIIGGGIAGASMAYRLAQKTTDDSRKILVIETESALGYHSTGRSAAEFTQRFHSNTVGKLTVLSEAFLNHPPQGFSDVALLKARGNLLIAAKEKVERLHEVFAAEQQHGPQGAQALQAITIEQALQRVPFLNTDYVAAAFYDPACWDIEVDNLLQGYVKGAKALGVEFLHSCQCQSAKRANDGWQINTSQGEIQATQVVNAAGAWADSIAALFDIEPLNIIPHRRTAISVKVPDYDLHHCPEVNEIDEDFYFKPDAGQLMVSPADETPVDPHDAWPEELDIAYAAHYLSEATTLNFDNIAHQWAGLRTFAADRLPVVGFSNHAAGFFWLAGQGGYGIQTSPALSDIASDLFLQRGLADTTQAVGITDATFAPSRFNG